MNKNLFVSVIIVAGGRGQRMNSDIPKQYIQISEKPILAHTIDTFQNSSHINQIILVTGKNEIEYCKNEIVLKYGFDKVSDISEGGGERQYSVKNGLKKVSEKANIIFVHDAVRPFVKDIYIKKLIDNTKKFGSSILAVKVKDTVKICDFDGFICDTPDRNNLWSAQTPQAFKSDIIKKAYEYAEETGFLGTDDSAIVEKAGYRIKITEGDYDNIKITTPEDLTFAKAIIKK